MKSFPEKIFLNSFFIISIISGYFLVELTIKIYAEENNNSSLNNIESKIPKNNMSPIWEEKINLERSFQKDILWKKIKYDEYIIQDKKPKDYSNLFKKKDFEIRSLNRSIVFDENSSAGPDINWLIPPGFVWNKRYKFDASVRGHNRRKGNQSFWGWNSGDAVGQFYYQFLNSDKGSFGLNFGMRSVYSGSAAGGGSSIGEGTSLGFRKDYRISSTAGLAFGSEQLLHFDGKTDTGRDIYVTLSKAYWRDKLDGEFPLRIYTVGLATGKMAEGNIKGLCSDFLGGSGTETNHKRRLCWAPIFSISSVYNKNLSTFFEYNSKFFLLGTSIVPSTDIPLRGTFAVQLSDHTNNYKLNSFDELKWVFRLSYGF